MLVVISLALCCSTVSADEAQQQPNPNWQDSVSFQAVKDEAIKRQVERAADWLKQHLVSVKISKDSRPARVIAWKDPTLDPQHPDLLAGYLITDTLWAAKALKATDPEVSRDMELGLQQLGWSGNGLHEVLFHLVDPICHRPDDEDIVHGHSIGRFSIDGGRFVDLRVMRQKSDANFTKGHPNLFAEHTVYQSLYEFWQGKQDAARQRLRSLIDKQRFPNSQLKASWDPHLKAVVDFANQDEYQRLQQGKSASIRHATFKLGVMLYAIRLLNLEAELTNQVQEMRSRLWEAQLDSGGLAHFLDIDAKAKVLGKGLEPTGEATSIGILSETVITSPSKEPTRKN